METSEKISCIGVYGKIEDNVPVLINCVAITQDNPKDAIVNRLADVYMNSELEQKYPGSYSIKEISLPYEDTLGININDGNGAKDVCWFYYKRDQLMGKLDVDNTAEHKAAFTRAYCIETGASEGSVPDIDAYRPEPLSSVVIVNENSLSFATESKKTAKPLIRKDKSVSRESAAEGIITTGIDRQFGDD